MRQKQVVKGLKNSQKVRVIINGVGFYTTVAGVEQMCFSDQRATVLIALERIASEKILGFASRTTSYDNRMQATNIDFQVDLV